MRPTDEYLWEAAEGNWNGPAGRAADIAFNRDDEPFLVTLMEDSVELIWVGRGWQETLLVRDDDHYFIASERAA